MKISKFKLFLGAAKYGWIDTKISNPIVKNRPIRIDHSGVFSFYDDLIDCLTILKYKKTSTLIIEEEGPETILEFQNYGNIIRVKIKQIFNQNYRYNYKYRYKDFIIFYNKKQFIKEFHDVVLNHYLKNKKEYTIRYYDFSFDINKMKRLNFN